MSPLIPPLGTSIAYLEDGTVVTPNQDGEFDVTPEQRTELIRHGFTDAPIDGRRRIVGSADIDFTTASAVFPIAISAKRYLIRELLLLRPASPTYTSKLNRDPQVDLFATEECTSSLLSAAPEVALNTGDPGTWAALEASSVLIHTADVLYAQVARDAAWIHEEPDPPLGEGPISATICIVADVLEE